MAQIKGVLYSGEPFKKTVTKRTKRLDLYKLDIKEIDFDSIEQAENLELIGFGPKPIEKINNLEKINLCHNLSDFYCTIRSSVNLDSLKLSSIKILHLTYEDIATDVFNNLPQGLKSLSMTVRSDPHSLTIDFRKLPSTLEDLTLGAMLSDIDFSGLEKLKLKQLFLCGFQMDRFELPNYGLEDLELFGFQNSFVEYFDTSPLRNSKKLGIINFLNFSFNYMDVTCLAELQSLHRLIVDDTKGMYMDTSYIDGTKKIKSSAIKSLENNISGL